MSEEKKNIDLGSDKLRENIFQVPTDYFSDLNKRIMSHIDDKPESSILDSDHLKENIFEVPEGYFENLAGRIQESTSEVDQVKVIRLHQRSWVRYVAAAVVVIGVFILGMKSDDAIEDWTQGLSDESIIEYLSEENLSGLDIIASLEDTETFLDELINDEMQVYNLVDLDNPELEYDFEYLEY